MKKIACIGNFVFDCNVSSDKFIKEDERNNYSNVMFSSGGPAANAASVIGRFGGNVDFYGKVGNDYFGNIISKELEEDNINLNHLEISNKTMTPFGFIIINTNKKTRTICSLRSHEDFVNPILENINYGEKYDLILTDGKYVDESIKLIKKNKNAIKIIDADKANEKTINLCREMDYIICSENFANKVTGMKISDDYYNNYYIYKQLENVFNNAKGIVITVGAKGYICKKENEVINFPAYKPEEEIIDTNGAGDIFHGAFTYALAIGLDYYKSLEFANVTAALSTTKRGGRKSIPDLGDVKNALKKQETCKILVKNFNQRVNGS